MSAAPDASAPLPSFLERFLEERSIKWMLGLGMLVLLGSSLKFVTHHWETYSPFWKYLVLIAYTAATYGIAEISRHRLALNRTGTGLLALTLCLLPLTFMSLRWVAPGLPSDFSALAHDAGLATLLCLNLAFAAFASRRILGTLLRTVPESYWLAYLALCISGALAPAVPTAFAPFAAIALWAVFTAGVVKVNRHVFWLAEEARWPRIFSFFPALLMAAQFLTVFILNFAPGIATPWLGFGLVLVAIPVLLTADSVAGVYLQRTSKLVYPWPAEIVGPLVIGLACCAGGMALALSDLPRPIAMAPTAALAALCVGAVARRTGQRAFAWAMLFCLLMAYQFTPVYFQQLARQVVQSAAELVHERRLPYAFYGITYAPFILGLVVAGRWLKSELFAAPCRQLSIVLSVVMLIASWTDPKAVFIAGAVLTVLWIVLRCAYEDSALQWGVGISLLSAACGVRVFLRDICLVSMSADCGFWSVTIAAGVLCAIDAASRALRRDDDYMSPFEFLSVSTLCVLAGGWFWQFGLHLTSAGMALPLTMVLLLGWHQRHRAYPLLGEAVLMLAGWLGLRYGMAIHLDAETLTLSTVAVLTTAWAIGRAVESVTGSRTIQAFRLPLLRVTTAGLVLMQILVLIGFTFPSGSFFTLTIWLVGGVVTTWSFIAAGRTLPAAWAHVGCVSVLALVGRGMFCLLNPTAAADWLPMAWAIAVVLGGAVARQIGRRELDEATQLVALHVDRFTFAAELLLACGTLSVVTWPARLAAVMALLSVAWRSRTVEFPALKHVIAELSFLHSLLGMLSFTTPARLIWDITPIEWHAVQIVGTFLAATWLLVLQTPQYRRWATDRDLNTAERTLWTLTVVVSGSTLLLTQSPPLSLIQVTALTGLFAILATDRFQEALRSRNVEDVWTGLGLIAAGVGYLAWFQVISLFHPATFAVGITAGLALSAIARVCRRSPNASLLAEPFDLVGFWLPAATAALCIGGYFTHQNTLWSGANSFVVLAAAACYFIAWIERRDSLSLLMATAIFNAAQALLWTELSWTDPQLYLMPVGLSLIALAEGLPRELPADLKTMLRYAGAMVILVSPLFHILDGSWLPLLTLMAASLAISVLSLGLRSRPLLYSGTAFLVADLIALIVRGSLERTDVLWVAGIALGTSVIALAGYCENHREVVLQRMRLVAATLQTWD